MADIFLSYARADAALAARIARELSRRGYSVWFDRDLPAHRAYSDVIATELEAASAVLVLWSMEAARSEWVRSEANRARESHKLVQARSDYVRLPMPFDQLQCADLRNWRGANSHPGWVQVLRSIDVLTVGANSKGATAATVGTSRRSVLTAAGAVGVISTGFAGWALWPRQHMTPEAQMYLQKGMDELQSNDAFELDNPSSLDQAIALLSNAVSLAPDSATAWGSLAMAFASRKKASPANERAGLDARSRSAAARALRIDSAEPRALGALRMLEPVYRNWVAAEREDREALKKQPGMPLLLFLLSDVLASVGRCSDAAAISRKFDRRKFLIAGADRKVIISLWSAGDLAAADDAIRQAVEHWPHNSYIWRTRIAYLTYTGRTTESLELLRNPTERPSDIDPHLVEAMETTIEALSGSATKSSARDKNREFLASNPSAIFGVAHAFAALTAFDDLFPILDGYYFGEGKWKQVAPAGGDANRQTAALFQPPMRAAWSDSRFNALLRRVGLEDYWRRSNTTPDFRRS